MKYFILLIAAALLCTGCDLYTQDEYREYYVVESYLVADAPLPRVLLSTTSPVDEKYNFKENAISDAAVEIRRLKPDSTIAERFSYQAAEPGIFIPVSLAQVQEQQLYQLHITLANGDSIEAKTFVPGNFRTVNKEELPEEYTYQSDRQIEITTTPSEYITDRQSYYIFTVNAIEPDSSKLTPFYRDLVEEQDVDIINFFVNSSGIINEKNYDRNADNTITLTVPWVAIAFFGSNDVIANTIDDNMYDFLRSQDVQTGGTTLSPGEIQNIRYHVNGGIGIFGSMASDTNRVNILRPTP